MPANALGQRILTAVVLVGLLLPAFQLLPKAFGVGLIALFVVGAAWEWTGFFQQAGRAGRVVYVAIIAAAMLASLRLVAGVLSVSAPGVVSLSAVAIASLLWWSFAFTWILRFPTPIGRAATMICGFLVLLPAWIALVALLEVGGRKLLLMALAVVWAADVGAYFAGRRFGRVKLAPHVSPGKTWEGVMGGVACAAFTAAAGAWYLGHPISPAIPMGIGVAAISIVGDLTVSMFKRNARLKDSGNLFPGHGGVLDRVDSVAAAMPLFVLEAAWLGWIGA